jgi:hypothetical protein
LGIRMLWTAIIYAADLRTPKLKVSWARGTEGNEKR